LTAAPRRTYSATGQSVAHISAGESRPTDYPASAKIEDRFDEMAKGTFGERLKRERELREVSTDEICSATRIAPKFLEALENEEWEKLPGGVFGRGFVRTIARYLGLSEENLLSEYDLARGEVITPSAQRPEERIPSTPKWVPATVLLVVIVVILALILGGRYAWRQHAARTAANKSSAIVSIPSTPEPRNISEDASSTGPARDNEPNIPLDLSIVASGGT
jgi:cytoskeleton protein RodZ